MHVAVYAKKKNPHDSHPLKHCKALMPPSKTTLEYVMCFLYFGLLVSAGVFVVHVTHHEQQSHKNIKNK